MEGCERKVLFKNQKILCDPELLFIVVDGCIVNAATEQSYGVSKIVGTVEKGSGTVGSLQCVDNEAAYRVILRKELIDALNTFEDEGAAAKNNSGNSSIPKPKKEKKSTRRVIVRNEGKLGGFGDVTLSDLEVIHALGKGTFGQVFLARHTDTNTLMALKCLDIKAIYKRKQQVFQHHPESYDSFRRAARTYLNHPTPTPAPTLTLIPALAPTPTPTPALSTSRTFCAKHMRCSV
jgi:hypothetical protein